MARCGRCAIRLKVTNGSDKQRREKKERHSESQQTTAAGIEFGGDAFPGCVKYEPPKRDVESEHRKKPELSNAELGLARSGTDPR
jgi:hypothetical protein